MKLSEVEHILRAARTVTEENEFVCIGSQAILAQFPNAPESLRASMELDLYPLHHPEKAEMIDGALGELSSFHESFRYYAHGVGPETALLPEGWQKRLISHTNENTNGAVGLCLEVHDLAFSKLVAGRTKDVEFVGELMRHGLAEPSQIETLINMEKDDSLRQSIQNKFSQARLQG